MTLRPGMVRKWVPFQEEEEEEFDPSSIAGLLAWYKADSLSLNDGDPVSTWTDSSGSGNDATEASGARPLYQTNELNGLPVVQFDGVDDQMVSSLSMATKPFTAFAVVKFATFVNEATILGPNASGGLQWRGNSDQRQGLLKSVTAEIGSSGTQLSVDTFYRLAATYSSGGAYTFYLNGTADGTGTNNQTFSATTLQLARNITGEDLTGQIAEILFYDSVLGTTDRQAVEVYLTDKWGL
jgi:hypothetical protein